MSTGSEPTVRFEGIRRFFCRSVGHQIDTAGAAAGVTELHLDEEPITRNSHQLNGGRAV